MTYKQTYNIQQGGDLTCPECQSKRFSYSYKEVVCTNCGWKYKITSNKYGAKRTEFNGYKYDSKYEASVAQSLELRKKAKDIRDYDKQFKVEIWLYREDGIKAFKVSHKVDFRIHHFDDSFELLEAKGIETADYKWRRRCLEQIWLPLHKDHTYTVVKQGR